MTADYCATALKRFDGPNLASSEVEYESYQRRVRRAVNLDLVPGMPDHAFPLKTF
ncbi:MAG: hypothetical protein KF722_12950 [Nitrospira sp.]|nr:hypothetical protein [Nitrospira sp.]